jgi:flagellar hook-associated protein 3 FlgL
MSSTIFGAATYGAGTYGILGTTIADAAAIRQRLDTLTAQSSSGYISSSYAGLGTGAATSLTLRPALAHTQTLQSGIDAATGSMDVAQSALSQISQIASNFFSQTNNLNGLNASDVDTIAASARDALKQVAGLLDSKYGNTYVFAGQDSSNAPVPDPDNILSSGFYTQISASISGLREQRRHLDDSLHARHRVLERIGYFTLQNGSVAVGGFSLRHAPNGIGR